MAEIKINNTIYPAVISGRISDPLWDGRSSKTITLEMDYATANELFVDGVEWSINDIVEDEETHAMEIVEYDNSEYSLAGDITDHRDGTISVKMGKPTDLEDLLEMLYGELSVGEVRE